MIDATRHPLLANLALDLAAVLARSSAPPASYALSPSRWRYTMMEYAEHLEPQPVPTADIATPNFILMGIPIVAANR